jgi:hypothetical protein
MIEQTKHVVCIEGKRNDDKLSYKLLNTINLSNEKKHNHQRARTLNWTIDDAFFAYDKQMEVLRRLITDDPALEERKFFIKEIKNKLDGYARPDAVNDIKDLTVFISLNACCY